jgi:Uncharacterised protein conserved in bacteria (DUF2336)
MRTRPLVEEFEAALASGSVARRIDILARITDLFICGAERYSKDQIDLFDDVMTRLVRTVVAKARAEVAERLAPIAKAPAHLIRALALDEDAAVANPVLSRSECLAERDLLEAGRTKSQQHLLAITRRRSLSEAVTDVLVERGDRDVMKSLVRHRGAQFSKAGLRRLAERQSRDGGDALATELGSRLDIDRYAREGKFAETVIALSQLCQMPIPAIERVLLKPDAEAVLVLAKAAGLSTATTRALLQLRGANRGMATKEGIPAKNLEQALLRFDRLPPESAQRVLGFFRTRVKKPAEPPVPAAIAANG